MKRKVKRWTGTAWAYTFKGRMFYRGSKENRKQVMWDGPILSDIPIHGFDASTIEDSFPFRVRVTITPITRRKGAR